MTLYENIAESLWQSCLNEDLGSAELYIQKLNEKALFGSMASSIKKWQKQIIQLTYEIKWLESGKMTPEVAQAVKAWKAAARDLSKKMEDPEFKAAVKAVDDNTGWFGRDKGKLGKKGSGFTSTRVNKDYGLVEEAMKPGADIDKIQATFTTFAKSAQNFVNQTKNIAQYGAKLPGTNFKKFLKKAGPVLSLGGLALGIAATAMSGGAAAPILAGVAGGMKTVGLGLTAGRSFAGAGRAFARGENGKGALKTGLGALSAYGAGMSAANIAGNVQSLQAAHQAAEEAAFQNSLVAPGTDTSPAMSPEWQTYKDGGIVDNWQTTRQPNTMGLQPGSVTGDVNAVPDVPVTPEVIPQPTVATPEVVQAVDSAPNVPIEQVETVTAAKAEVLPEIQQAMPEATPDVQDSVAEYAAKYGAEVSTTPQGDIELSYEDGTAEIIKDATGEGDLVAVDVDTGVPVEEVTPQEVPEGAAEQALGAGEPVTAQAGALDANNFAERAASAGIKSKDFTYMRINALEMKDGGTIYDIRPGMELTVPKGADYGIVSLKQGYVLDTTSGNIIPQPEDYMKHVFDKPPKYLGSMSFGHEVMKLSDIKI